MGLTIFGDIFSSAGALFVLHAGEIRSGIIEVYVEIFKATAIAKGYSITPQLAVEILVAAKFKADELIEKHRRLGVPQVFNSLFTINKKAETEKYCNTITICARELSLLATNYDQIGFKHRRHHSQVVPQHLRPTDKEKSAFFYNGVGALSTKEAKTFVRKTTNTFKERKNINAHLFERNEEWHLFYFTYDDINAGAKGKRPHWSAGDHIHYISHLWALDKEYLWQQIISSDKRPFNGIHIRYFEEPSKD